MAHPGGRPSEYYPEVVDQIYKYLETAVPENMTFPQVEEFADSIGITKKTLYNWSKKHKELLHALKILKQKQKIVLSKIGVFGGKEINSNIVSLLLKVNHNMVEQSALDLTTKGKQLPSPIYNGKSTE